MPHLADRGGHLHWRGNVQGRAPFVLALYVAGASGLATAGDTRSTALLLAAVAVTLPLGVIAFVGVYVAYGVIVELARALGAQVMNGNGWGPSWFVVADELVVGLLFAAVALANGVVLRQFWLGARVGRQKPARR